MGARDKLRRLEHALRGNLESFELVDGSRHYYDRLETARELFLHSIDCLRAVEELPEPPEVYLKMCQAKDPVGVLERFGPSDKPAWFIEVSNDWDVLISEHRLENAHAAVETAAVEARRRVRLNEGR